MPERGKIEKIINPVSTVEEVGGYKLKTATQVQFCQPLFAVRTRSRLFTQIQRREPLAVHWLWKVKFR